MKFIYGRITLASILMAALPLKASTRYIDGTARGANNGTSWSDAWTTLGAASGLAPGDTVYISGGPDGSSQTYKVNVWATYPGQWGNVVNGVTYKIGQDSAHNGTAVFDCLGGNYWLVQGWNNVVVSGDGGDGRRHFKAINAQNCGLGNNWQDVRISYIDFSQINGTLDMNPASNVEIDNCYFYTDGAAPDHTSFAKFNGASYDTSSFHDNLVYIPRSATTAGIGADGLQWIGSGYSIYNNRIISYSSPIFVGGQHQDGWQATGPGSYIKVYGNVFVDMENYAIFQEPAFGGYTHSRIYNNIAIMTHPNTTQGIVVAGSATKPANDVIVANNITDGYFYGYTFRNGSDISSPGAFIGCAFYNNISVNSGGANIVDLTVASANNQSILSSDAPKYFASYTPGSPSNDYHLKSTANTLISAGTNLYQTFTIDKDSKQRTSAGSWDIGPYINAPTSLLNAPTNTRISSTAP